MSVNGLNQIFGFETLFFVAEYLPVGSGDAYALMRARWA
jgi:hypothetical protein